MLLYWVVVVAAARALKMLEVCEAAPARFAASVLACPDGTGSARTCAAKVLKAAAAVVFGPLAQLVVWQFCTCAEKVLSALFSVLRSDCSWLAASAEVTALLVRVASKAASPAAN